MLSEIIYYYKMFNLRRMHTSKAEVQLVRADMK